MVFFAYKTLLSTVTIGEKNFINLESYDLVNSKE
jgi:hypothetical protein